MRARSITVNDFDEEDAGYPNIPVATKETTSKTSTRRHSVIVSKDWQKKQESFKLNSMKKALAEVWQENETSITLKMLSESMKNNDSERVLALKRSLLDLEAKYDKNASENEETISSPNMIKIKTAKSQESPQLSKLYEGSESFSPQETQYLEKAILQNTKCYDLQINIMIIGNSQTGKTSLMQAIIGIENPLQTKPTTGLDSKSLLTAVNGKHIRYKIIDSDGDKNKEFIRKVYYDMCQIIVVLFDLTKLSSIEDSAIWCKSVRHITQKEPLMYLVGNKADETEKRVVTKELAEVTAKKNEMEYYEISVKLNQGIKELREKITSQVIGSKLSYQ